MILLRPTTLVIFAAIASANTAIAQENDEEYTAKILEYTTEPFFLTPHVDHLPASSTVPTPAAILGHIVGAPDVLSYPAEIYEYMRALAAASPRVEVFSIGETEEGREMIIVAISDEETIARLDDYKAMLQRLGDPRVTSESEAERLIQQAKPMYWATGAIHSPETGSPEMLMELAYRLAVSEREFIRQIRDDAVVLITPVVEVDGRAKMVDLHMAPRRDPEYSGPTRPLYWGKYVAHDNNRDGIGLSLKLSQNITHAFLEFRPQILHDLHESASHLYTSTGRGPYNAWLDPITINEWNNLAYKEVKDMTAMGVPGVYTHDFYDGWAPNYMFWIAQSHNAIGRFYETQGAGNASTRVLRTNVEREWHRPNTPLGQVMWSIRNNVNLQQSAILIAMNYVATNKEEFLRNYYLKSVRSVAKATTEGPAAYVFPATDTRPALQARLLRLMRGGLELSGVVNLSTFVQAGGAFVTITSSSSLPIHFGLTQGLLIKATPTLWARGGVFHTHVSESSSPIAYGYENELGVYFNSSPVFTTERTGRGRGGFGRRSGEGANRGGPGSTLARRTGRGGIDDEDIVQGRRQDLGLAGVEAFQASQEDQGETQTDPRFGSAAPPNNNRIVFRFASADDLLISGGVNNAGEMSGTPALVDAPHGDGHIVMFSFNPFWRGETVGSYSLVFNTLMHYKHLDAGKPRKPATTEPEDGTR